MTLTPGQMGELPERQTNTLWCSERRELAGIWEDGKAPAAGGLGRVLDDVAWRAAMGQRVPHLNVNHLCTS